MIGQVLEVGFHFSGYTGNGIFVGPDRLQDGSKIFLLQLFLFRQYGRMHVHYNVRRNDERATNYVCFGRGREYGARSCQSILGNDIDAAVGKLLVEAVTPMALELTLNVQQEIQFRIDEADRLRHLKVERAQYEADHARFRYMQIDPHNRLVADSLEADWNEKLRALAEARKQYEEKRSADRLVIDETERGRVLSLAADFPAIWNDPNTPQRERKRMLALLIEDVTLTKGKQVNIAVRFRGGTTTVLTVPRPLTPQQLRATDPEVRRQIDEHPGAPAAEKPGPARR